MFRPQDLDQAARRRFEKRFYVPLPERDARIKIIKDLLETGEAQLDIALNEHGYGIIAEDTEGFGSSQGR